MPEAAWSKAWVWGRSFAGDCEFESRLGHGCLSLACCEVEVSATAGHSSRGVILSVCVCVLARARVCACVSECNRETYWTTRCCCNMEQAYNLDLYAKLGYCLYWHQRSFLLDSKANLCLMLILLLMVYKCLFIQILQFLVRGNSDRKMFSAFTRGGKINTYIICAGWTHEMRSLRSLVSRVSYITKTLTTELTYRDSRPIDTK